MPYCQLCKKEVDQVHYDLEQWLMDTIRNEHPNWIAEDGTCEQCKQYYNDLGEININE